MPRTKASPKRKTSVSDKNGDQSKKMRTSQADMKSGKKPDRGKTKQNQKGKKHQSQKNTEDELLSVEKSVLDKDYTEISSQSISANRWKPWYKQALQFAFDKCAGNIWLGDSVPDMELCDKLLKELPENPGVTSQNIQTFLYNICARERRTVFLRGNPIDPWAEVMEAISPDDNVIAKQLELIMSVAKQEPSDDAPMHEAFDPAMPIPNYEAIYDYFSKAFTNEPLPELTPLDSLVVEDCIQSLAFQVESLNDGELRKNLRRVYLHITQDPERVPETDHDDVRKSLMQSVTVLNPLGLNAQAIVPVTPK